MTAKIVDKEQRKDEIALTALSVFAEKGFEGASIKDIALNAGISKGSVYDYFRSKDDLIAHSLKLWINSAGIESDKNERKLKGPEERLRKILKDFTDIFFNNSEFIKLYHAIFRLLMSNRLDKKTRSEFFYATLMPSVRLLADIIKDGAEQGLFEKYVLDDTERIALTLIAAMDGIGFYYHITGDKKEALKNIEFLIENQIRNMKIKKEI